MQAKITKIRTNFLRGDSDSLIFVIFILAVIVLGIILRSLGIYNSLWHDEATWARKLINNPFLYPMGFRPIGYMTLTKILVTIKNNELTLRLLPYLSSILSIILTYFIAKEFFRSKITVFLSVFTVSFNPILINFAKEFKPYSTELFIHQLVILVMFLYIKKKIYLTSYQIIGIMLVALPFAYNIVFLYPSIFLLLLIEAYQEKNFKEFYKLIKIISLGFGLLLLIYIIFWSKFTGESVEIYWGKKYNVFGLYNDVLSRAKWIAEKYVGLICGSGRAEVFWDFFSIKYEVSSRISFFINSVEDRIINVVLLIAHFIGLIFLVFRKQIKYLLLFVLPVLVVIFLNLLGKWPFGPFRTNLFLFCYFVIISFYGFDVIINTPYRRLNQFAGIFIAVILIFLQLPFKPGYYRFKLGDNPDIKSVLKTISDVDRSALSSKLNKRPRVILAEDASYYSVMYYLENHSVFSKRYKKIHDNSKIVRLRRMREIDRVLNTIPGDYLDKGDPIWIVNSYWRDFNKLNNYLVKNNIVFHKVFQKDRRFRFKESELIIYYLPRSVSNILTLDHESGFVGISGLSEMDINSVMADGKEVLLVRVNGKDSCFQLRNIKYPVDKSLSVSAHVDSPAQTDFRIFYMTESDKQYSESKSVNIWIEHGKNTLSAVINDNNIYGEIRICPGGVIGDYVISDITINAIDNL